jgi:hypothetical protein
VILRDGATIVGLLPEYRTTGEEILRIVIEPQHLVSE